MESAVVSMKSRMLLSMIMVLQSSICFAFPSIFLGTVPGASKNCSAHPRKAYGMHKPPVVDRTTKLILLAPKGQADPEKTGKLCKGVTYTFKVSFGENFPNRFALMTANVGTLASKKTYKKWTFIFDSLPDVCIGKRLVVQPFMDVGKVPGFNSTFTADGTAASAKVISVKLEITSNYLVSGAFQYLSKTYKLAKC